MTCDCSHNILKSVAPYKDYLVKQIHVLILQQPNFTTVLHKNVINWGITFKMSFVSVFTRIKYHYLTCTSLECVAESKHVCVLWNQHMGVAAEVFLVGPADGALYQDMTLDFDGMWTVAHNKCVWLCLGVRERNRKIEQERWKVCVYGRERKREK